MILVGETSLPRLSGSSTPETVKLLGGLNSGEVARLREPTGGFEILLRCRMEMEVYAVA